MSEIQTDGSKSGAKRHQELLNECEICLVIGDDLMLVQSLDRDKLTWIIPYQWKYIWELYKQQLLPNLTMLRKYECYIKINVCSGKINTLFSWLLMFYMFLVLLFCWFCVLFFSFWINFVIREFQFKVILLTMWINSYWINSKS